MKKLIHTILSICGFVPEHMTIIRGFFMFGSVLVSIFLLPKYAQLNYAMVYYIFSTFLYIGFIFLILPERGLRLKLIERLGEEKAYLYYEGFLAFAFFHNGVALSFISQSSVNSGYWGDFPQAIVMGIFLVLFTMGFTIKIWAAYIIGVPIYYWKDMFLGRKICDFSVSGPYKYFNNPMYGIGQLQGYALAIYYNSIYGFIFVLINQSLIFLFYFTVEKPFIHRTYLLPNKNLSGAKASIASKLTLKA